MIQDILGFLNKKERVSWQDALLLGMLFLLLPAIKWIPFAIGVLFVTVVFQSVKRGGPSAQKKPRWMTLGWLSVIFFFMHVLGVLWSEDQASAWDNIERKLTLLALPVIAYLGEFKVNRKEVKLFYITGLWFASLLLFGYATWRFILSDDPNRIRFFLESEFSFFMHRSYLATYFSLGLLLVVWDYFLGRRAESLASIALFLITIILSGSKSGFLVLAIGVPVMAAVMAWKRNKRRPFYAVGIILLMVSVLLVVSDSKMAFRFKRAFSMFGEVEVYNNPSVESTSARVMMWSASWQVMEQYPWLGVGTGDSDQALCTVNQARNNQGVARERLNAHNQFLNTGVQLGLLGMGWLMMLFVWIIRRSVLQQDEWMLITSLILAFSFLFESFLESRSGIVPTGVILLAGLLSSVQPSGKLVVPEELKK